MKTKHRKITFRYYIILFNNKKRKKLLYRSATKEKVLQYWHEFKTQQPPRFIKMNSGKNRTNMVFELGLIFPKTRFSKQIYSKDSLGRNVEITLSNDKQVIKEMIPYWEEELIYDFENKKRIRYHELLEYILTIKDISQIFTLNNKVFIQIENEIRMFGNKNISDASRLFELIKEDVLRKRLGNFIFVKDVNRNQRIFLYNLLVEKGYKRRELFRHYSY